MFERFTEGARRAIFYARHQAAHRRLGEITPTDLVLGVAMEGRRVGTNSPMLGSWDDLLILLELEADKGECPKDEDLPLSQLSKKALAYAEREAMRDDRYSIDESHLLRGVLRTRDEVVAKLGKGGITLCRYRKFSAEEHKKTPDKRAPFRYRLSAYRKFVMIAFAIIFLAALLFLHSQGR